MYLKKLIMIKVDFRNRNYFIDSLREKLKHLAYHRLAFQSLSIFASQLIVLNFINVERRKRVVINQRDEVTKRRKSIFRVIPYQSHHYLNWALVSNHFNHLLSIYNQIVFIYSLDKNRTKIFYDRSTTSWTNLTLNFNFPNNCSHYI